MITLYSGTPGSGKSLHSASIINIRLKRNLPVIANFEINKKLFKKKENKIPFTYMENNDMTPETLLAFSRNYFKTHKFKEGAIWVFIDEAQLIFNAREWRAMGRAGWLSFFTQHRHFGFNIILLAQFDRMLDRQVRCLLEYEYIHRKAGNMGGFGGFLSLLSFGNLFIFVKKWYPVREKIGHEFYIPSRKLFKFYDSYKDFKIERSPDGPAVASEPSEGQEPKPGALSPYRRLRALVARWLGFNDINKIPLIEEGTEGITQ